MQIIHGNGVPKKEIGLWIARTRFFFISQKSFFNRRNDKVFSFLARYLARYLDKKIGNFSHFTFQVLY